MYHVLGNQSYFSGKKFRVIFVNFNLGWKERLALPTPNQSSVKTTKTVNFPASFIYTFTCLKVV